MKKERKLAKNVQATAPWDLSSGLEANVTSQKRKRLNKYIETKMKNERKAEILQKLSEVTVDPSLFASSKSIGESRELKKRRIKQELLEESTEHSDEIPARSTHLANADIAQTYKMHNEELRPSSQTAASVCGKGLEGTKEQEVPDFLRGKPNNREFPQSMPSTDDPGNLQSMSSGDGCECDSENHELCCASLVQTRNAVHTGKIINLEPEHQQLGRSAKSNAFKEWAISQNQSRTVEIPKHEPPDTPVFTRVNRLLNSLPPSKEKSLKPLPPFDILASRKANFVSVRRSVELQASRLKLPIVAEEQSIMEAIQNNSCVVICGETGSGKTTQAPQFLYEAGYGSKDSPTPGIIGVTQPRRVAAVAMANRVSEELGDDMNDKVSYQIRFDGTVGPNTIIKFMTDGILLRELAQDFLLRKYSAIIIDEAHERSINTDILIGVMSRVLRLRQNLSQESPEHKPLKLIIMSATLRVADFVGNNTLFPNPPPLLKIDARQHPVTIHFSKKTPINYTAEVFRKVCRIHRRLPAGGILVFLTGRNEIIALQAKLQDEFRPKNKTKAISLSSSKVTVLHQQAVVEAEDVDLGAALPIDVNDSDNGNTSDEDDLGDGMSADDFESLLHVLPLYSLLPTNEQMKIFEDPPAGSRLCILATNIAETSLTIPGISYVVDCGRSKERRFDQTTGVQSFDVQWTSKASAAQRAGRAGRTGPGHCYRLFSSAVFERDFSQFTKAEILRMPIEGVVLQMKAMGIDSIANFPFPTSPDRLSLQNAERVLQYLRAVSPRGSLSSLGKTMNIFPVAPRFAKMLIIGQQHDCLPYVIAIVAALSVSGIFVPRFQPSTAGIGGSNTEPKSNHATTNRQNSIFTSLDAHSDVLKLLSVVCAFEYEKNQKRFCTENHVRLKAMEEIRMLRQQLASIIMSSCPGVMIEHKSQLLPPSKLQVRALNQIVSAAFIDHVAIRADLLPNSPFKLMQLKRLANVPFLTLFPSERGSTSDKFERVTYVHPESILHSAGTYPEYLIYSNLVRSNHGRERVHLSPLTAISGTQLASLADSTPLLTYSKPLESKPPRVLPNSGGRRRECWVVPTISATTGKINSRWPLPPQKIIQEKKGNTQEWIKG